MKKRNFLARLGISNKIAEYFHRLYYNSSAQTWENTYWMGHKVRKIPFDLWIYQEIFYHVKPDLIIETGTDYGGSALYYAHLLDILGEGKIITVDVRERENRPQHPRIQYLAGSSVEKNITDFLKNEAQKAQNVLLILDSDHSCKHVSEELKLLAPLVTVGSYVIVEDSNINGHPVARHCGAGPFEAIEDFLSQNPQFKHDENTEKFLVTFNPKGYLKRIQ
jgi:cephalosporin hydroxylase